MADSLAITQLLDRAADGESSAAGELLPLVYDALRELAGGYLRDQRAGHTLQPTALVHEAYVKLVGQSSIQWQSRAQFFALAARAMRSILIDHARGKARAKRGGDWKRITVSAVDTDDPGRELDLLALDEALERLAALDPRQAQLVELRFFGGMTSEEAAEVLGISRATAAEDWRLARAWLLKEIRKGDES